MVRSISILLGALLLLSGLCLPSATYAEETAAEARVRRETIRQAIQLAFDDLSGDLGGRNRSAETLETHTAIVASFGTEAIEFLLPEVENPSMNFYIALAFLAAIGDQQSVPVLRRAMTVADERSGDRGRDRKAWLGVTLARMGVEEAVDLLEDGNTASGSRELLSGALAMDLAAVATAPASIDRLIARFVRITEAERTQPDEEPSAAYVDRAMLLHAARFAATSHPHQGLLDLARSWTTDPEITVRIEMLGILLDHGNHDDLPRAFSDFEDPALFVRREAARLFAEVAEPNDALKMISLLKNEESVGIRATFQTALIRLLGEAARTPLEDEMQETNPLFRINALKAAEQLGSAGTPMLHKALRDPDLRVSINAQLILLRQRDPILLNALLPHLLDNNWGFARTAITTVTDLSPKVAGPRIAARLIQKELKPGSLDYLNKDHIDFLLQELVRTRFTAATNDLEKSIAATTREDLQILSKPFIEAFRVMEKNEDDPASWRQQLKVEQPWIRRLARERLFELGDDEGIASIAELFPDLPREEQEHCMAYAARFPKQAFADRIIDVLGSTEFDGASLTEIRRQAAWAAFRLGTEQMQETLAENVMRRKGLDYPAFLYWIEMDAATALPWIGQTRNTRLLSHRYDRMYEQVVLDRLERRWRRQIPPFGFDRPPIELRFPG